MQPVLQWKSNEYYTTCVYVCICSLRYPACNVHAPYCQVWPAPLYNIFPHFLICGTIFFWGVGWVGGGVGWGEVLPTKCVCFDFLYKFV